jgi:hypothetical protein
MAKWNDTGIFAPIMENIESLSPADFADLKLAHFLLENESLAVRLQSKLGRPIHQGMQRLPARWRNRITKSAENAMGKALDMAMKTMGEDEPRRPQNKLHRVLVGTSGAVGGAFGLAALAVELPVSTTIMLRSIAEIARSQGENLSTMDARLACLEVFALGGRSGEDDHAETGYYAVRAVLASQVGEVLRHLAEGTLGRTAASPVTRLISSLAARFGVVVSEKVMATAIPVVGAAGGALINTMFMDHFQKAAQGHFIMRRLERKYPRDMVEAEYSSLSQ